MLAVGENDRTGLSAAGAVNDPSAVLCVLNQPLDGGGFGTDDGEDPFGSNQIAESDVDHVHKRSRPLLLNVLNLLADLFDLTLDVHYQTGDGGILAF